VALFGISVTMVFVWMHWCPGCMCHRRDYSMRNARVSHSSTCFYISVPSHVTWPAAWQPNFTKDRIYLPRPFSPPCPSVSALWRPKRSCSPYWAAEQQSRANRAAGRWRWGWRPCALLLAEINMSARPPWTWRRSEGTASPTSWIFIKWWLTSPDEY